MHCALLIFHFSEPTWFSNLWWNRPPLQLLNAIEKEFFEGISSKLTRYLDKDSVASIGDIEWVAHKYHFFYLKHVIHNLLDSMLT